MQKRKFEVHGVDGNGDLWIVAAGMRATAESIANRFRKEGFSDVKILENPDA